MSLERDLESLRQKVNKISAGDPPPATAFELHGQTRSETAWQSYLSYFLQPEPNSGRHHQLEDTFLRCFLTNVTTISSQMVNRTLRCGLDRISVQTEVGTENQNIPDLVVACPEEWFVCIELKLASSEDTAGTAQTERYAADTDVAPGGSSEYEQAEHLYIKLSEEPNSTSPKFVDVDWEQLLPVINKTMAEASESGPLASVAQLADFRRTIRAESTNSSMSDEVTKNLYFQCQNSIDAVEDAIEPFVERVLQQEWPDSVESNLAGTEAAQYNWQYYIGGGYGQIRPPRWVAARDGPAKLDIHYEHHPRADIFKRGQLGVSLELEEPDRSTISRKSEQRYHDFREEIIDRLPALITEIQKEEMQIDPGRSQKILCNADYQFEPGNEQEYYTVIANALNDLVPITELVSNILDDNSYAE